MRRHPASTPTRLWQGFSGTPEAAIAELQMTLDQTNESARENRRKEREAAEKEARAALADQKKAGVWQLVASLVGAVVSALGSTLSAVSEIGGTAENPIAKPKMAKWGTALTNISAYLKGIGDSIAKRFGDKAAEHGVEKTVHDNAAADAGETVSHAEQFGGRTLNHLDKVSDERAKAQEAAIIR